MLNGILELKKINELICFLVSFYSIKMYKLNSSLVALPSWQCQYLKGQFLRLVLFIQ